MGDGFSCFPVCLRNSRTCARPGLRETAGGFAPQLRARSWGRPERSHYAMYMTYIYIWVWLNFLRARVTQVLVFVCMQGAQKWTLDSTFLSHSHTYIYIYTCSPPNPPYDLHLHAHGSLSDTFCLKLFGSLLVFVLSSIGLYI